MRNLFTPENLFLPYELSFLAKTKGFDDPCFARYLDGKLTGIDGFLSCDKMHTYNSIIKKEGDCAAPLYTQIIDWIFEKLKSNPYFTEIVYCGSKPTEELHSEIESWLKVID